MLLLLLLLLLLHKYIRTENCVFRLIFFILDALIVVLFCERMFGVSMLECEFACLKTEYDRDLKTKMNDITDNRNSNKKHQEVTTTTAAAATDI